MFVGCMMAYNGQEEREERERGGWQGEGEGERERGEGEREREKERGSACVLCACVARSRRICGVGADCHKYIAVVRLTELRVNTWAPPDLGMHHAAEGTSCLSCRQNTCTCRKSPCVKPIVSPYFYTYRKSHLYVAAHSIHSSAFVYIHFRAKCYNLSKLSSKHLKNFYSTTHTTRLYTTRHCMSFI